MILGRLTSCIAILSSIIAWSFALAATTATAAATNYYWNLSTGTWDIVSKDWNTPNSNSPVGLWSNDSPAFDSTAIFNTGAGTVTLGTIVDPNVIDFNSTGYTLVAPSSNPNNFQINMSGAAPAINVGSGTATFAATINANLTSSGPLTISDTGTGNTTLTLGGTTTISGGSLRIVGNVNAKDTFTINAPSLSLTTLTFTSPVGSTTNFAPKPSSAAITFNPSGATINTGEGSNSSYKDISYITEKVIGPTTAPLTFMSNDALGTQSALSFTNVSDSFVGGIAVQAASSSVFNSNSLTATGTTRLNFNVAGANGTGSGAGPIYVYANGAIITDQGSQAAFTLSMANNVFLNYGNMTPSQGIFVTAIGGTKATSGNTTINYSGQISGNGSILIGNDVGPGSGGAGVSILSGAQKTYTGETIMNGSVTAIFQMGATNVLPSGTTLMFGNAAPGQDLNNSIGALDLNGFSQTIASLQSNVDPASTINGITNTNATTMATLTITGSTVDTFIGSLGVTSQTLLLGTSNNKEAMTRTGSGTTILGSALNGNSSLYIGNTLVNGTSTLEAGSFTAFSPNSNYTVESKLDLAGYNNTINSLTSTTTGGVVTSSLPNQNLNGQPTILTIGSNSTANANTTPVTSFLGVLTDGPSAPLGLTKAGQGTQTLAGANTYSGPTTVNNGVLTIAATGSLSSASTVTINGGTLNGAGAVGGPVTVMAGATLAGTLSIGGSVGVNTSATISPGSPGVAGALTVGSLTLFGGSNYNWKVTNAAGTAGSGYDTVSAAGITIDPSASTTPINVNVSILDPNFNGAVSQHWTLASSTGALSLPGGTTNASRLFNAFTTANVFGPFSVSATTVAPGSLTLTYTPVTLQTLTWQGGTGVWQPAATAGDTAWNNGSSNGPFNSSSIAEFASGSGTVVLSAPVSAAVLRFDTTGYTISGGSGNFALSATPSSGISTLDVQVTNSTDSAAISAGIASPLIKYGAGTLILSGGNGNTFGASNGSGGSLTIYAGTVRGGSTSLNAGTIQNSGIVAFDQSGISNGTYAGTITGTGSVVVQNSTPSTPQTLTLSGSNSYIGGTTIGDGATLSVASSSNFGGPTANLTLNGGTLQTTAVDGITFSGALNVTTAGGAITDQDPASVNQFAGGGNLASGAVLTKNGQGILQILGNGLTGSGSIVVTAGSLLVGNEADPNSNPSTFLGNNSVTLNNNTTLTIAAGTASTASINPPALNLTGNVTLALFKTGGLVGQGPLEPSLNSTTIINPGSNTASSTITIAGSNDFGNSLAGSSNLTLGNTTFSPTSGTITIQTVAGSGVNGISTGLTFGAVTDNGDAVSFLGQGNNALSVSPGPGIQFNGVTAGTIPTLTGPWTIGDPSDTNGQVVVVAVQRVTNSQFALTTGSITVNPGSQLSITPATGTYGPTTGTQTITLFGSGPNDSTGSATGALTVAGKSVATFDSNVAVSLASSSVTGLSGPVLIDLSNGSSTQQTILTFNGPVTGSAGLDLQGGDLTQLVFAGANGLTGHTHIKGGQLVINSNSSIGTGGLSMEQTTTHNPTLILNNATQSVSNLSSTYGTQTLPGVAVTQTIQLNGAALTINETDFSGMADYGISPTDGTIIPGSAAIITGTGSITYAGAPASAGNPAAYLSLSSKNTYSGGTTVTGGTLATTLGGTLGNGPLSLVAADGVATGLSLGGNQIVASLSNSTVGAGVSTLAVANGSTMTVSGNLGNSGTLTLGTVTAPGATSAVGGGTVQVNGAANLAASSQIIVNTGALQFNATSGSATINGSGATAPSVVVNNGATLQLAGTVSGLSNPVSGNAANINNNSSATGPGVGGLQVTGTNQSVGVISGSVSASSAINSQPIIPTTYSGDTVVSANASLTATQILQNTLTIGAGASVTIAPSGTGISVTAIAENGSNSVVASNSTAIASSNIASSTVAAADNALTTIQAAIASGSISSVTSERLENRVAAIERLATGDPGLDTTLLESRVLASLPSPSIWSSNGTSALNDTGAEPLSLDSGTFASDSNVASGIISAAFSPNVGSGGDIAAVPEPSSILLAGLGMLGIAALGLKRSRTNNQIQGS